MINANHSINEIVIDNYHLASLIDHTILRPDATQEDVVSHCVEAINYGFASVCVNPCMVDLVSQTLKNTSVKTCSVIGFPLGATSSFVKAVEASIVVMHGAEEIDIVMNIGLLKSGRHSECETDIQIVRNNIGNNVLLKVIIETCLLTDNEKKVACNLAIAAGADFVKTSTGFSKAGATISDVHLIRQVVGPSIGVKASGGIRTREQALAMINAGANRIGASSGVALLSNIHERDY
jgi:deoxyribose-phosphate aldolase